MKKLLCLLMALVLLFLTGCSAMKQTLQENLNDPQIQEKTEAVLDCLLAGDVEGAWSFASSAGTKEQFASFYQQIKPLLEGIDSYTLEPHYVNVTTTNGVTTKSLRYLLTSGQTQLWVTATTEENVDTLVGFQIYMVTTETGTLATAGDNDPVQWVFLVIGLMEMAFVVVILIDCIRHKMKKKWLWILLILLGGITVLLTVTPQNIGLRFNYGLFLNAYTALIKYNTGGFMFRLYAPVGAIVYLCLRRTLLKSKEQAPAPQEKTEE